MSKYSAPDAIVEQLSGHVSYWSDTSATTSRHVVHIGDVDPQFFAAGIECIVGNSLGDPKVPIIVVLWLN